MLHLDMISSSGTECPENENLEKETTTRKVQPQRKNKKNMSLERIQAIVLFVMGFIVCGMGLVGLVVKFCSLHNLLGCLAYITVGMIIVLKTSSSARNYVRRLVLDGLPPNIISLMFEK